MTDQSSIRTINLGLLGCGVVGGGLVKLVDKHRDDFRANGFELRITHVGVRDASKKRGVDLSSLKVTTDPMAVANDPDIDMLVEVMGGNTIAVDAGCAALSRGIPLISANKSALSRSLGRYIESAKQSGAGIGFESAAAAHIPIIEVLDRSLACEELTLIKGVINGSTNYILTFMERAGCEYEDALADAASKGFTEADPSLDVEGIDAAEKLTLLALKAFGAYVAPDSVHTEGITRISQADIRLALALNHRIKLVAAARRTDDGLSLRVHPALVHRGELLADVDSEFNAIIIEGPGFKELTFLGKGAGELPTASAVLNDIVKLVRQPGSGSLPGFRRAAADLPMADTSELKLCYFLRMGMAGADVNDALSALAGEGIDVLSHATIEHGGENFLGVITDVIEERRMMATLPEISRIKGVNGAVQLIRLDKDNYRDIVEREQSTYFGSSLKRESGPGV
ncbi:MAG: homoserine dehydrogenase [Planctomycetes bacterium]|nr:homoserine dehydrogenase [Planctomycetota bacterium]